MKANSDELQSFVSVVDSGSISAAAEQMGLTASAVSRTLSRLEHKLGTTLLNRTTRRMELTEEGRYFLDQARQILQQMEALEERLALRRQSPPDACGSTPPRPSCCTRWCRTSASSAGCTRTSSSNSAPTT